MDFVKDGTRGFIVRSATAPRFEVDEFGARTLEGSPAWWVRLTAESDRVVKVPEDELKKALAMQSSFLATNDSGTPSKSRSLRLRSWPAEHSRDDEADATAEHVAGESGDWGGRVRASPWVPRDGEVRARVRLDRRGGAVSIGVVPANFDWEHGRVTSKGWAYGTHDGRFHHGDNHLQTAADAFVAGKWEQARLVTARPGDAVEVELSDEGLHYTVLSPTRANGQLQYIVKPSECRKNGATVTPAPAGGWTKAECDKHAGWFDHNPAEDGVNGQFLPEQDAEARIRNFFIRSWYKSGFVSDFIEAAKKDSWLLRKKGFEWEWQETVFYSGRHTVPMEHFFTLGEGPFALAVELYNSQVTLLPRE